MLSKGTASIYFLLGWAFASPDLSLGGASSLTGQVSDLRTEVPKFGDGGSIDHESTLVPMNDGEVVGSGQRITVTYTGSSDNEVLDSFIRNKTPPSKATGRKLSLFQFHLTSKDLLLTRVEHRTNRTSFLHRP